MLGAIAVSLPLDWLVRQLGFRRPVSRSGSWLAVFL